MPVTKYSYGYVEAFLKAYPEIAKAVAAAVKAGEEPEKFQMRLKSTTWYKSRSEAQRAFDTLQYNDPQEYNRRVALRQQALSQMASQLGVAVSASTLATWAKNMERVGAGDDEMRLLLGSQGALDINKASGLASTTVDQLRSLASDYGIPASDDTLTKQTRDVLSGKNTAQGLTDYYREQAKRQYGSIADELDAGRSVREMAQPYLDMASEELGVPADQMDLRDSRWTTMFQGDAAMTYDQFRAVVRQDERYGWINGTKAKQSAASMVGEIAKRFGAF
jgi:hypothetical protein